jgi:hypothetical protein
MFSRRAAASALVGTLLAALLGVAANAQQPQRTLAQQLSGAWFLTSTTDKVLAVGTNPKGSVILDGSGNFGLQIVGGDLAKLAANDRLKGTAAENKAVAQRSLAYFGTYSVDEAAASIILTVFYGSFPNWDDVDQKWKVSFDAGQMIWTSADRDGAVLVWNRAPATIGSAFTTRGRHY